MVTKENEKRRAWACIRKMLQKMDRVREKEKDISGARLISQIHAFKYPRKNAPLEMSWNVDV